MSPAEAPTRYRLRVSAGPSANPKDLKVIPVNDDANPTLIESDEFIGQIVVRIRGLDKTFGYKEGQEQDSLGIIPESTWFSLPGGDNNLSSVQISGRFKREWPGEQVVFGVSSSLSFYFVRHFFFFPCDVTPTRQQFAHHSSPNAYYLLISYFLDCACHCYVTIIESI